MVLLCRTVFVYVVSGQLPKGSKLTQPSLEEPSHVSALVSSIITKTDTSVRMIIIASLSVGGVGCGCFFFLIFFPIIPISLFNIGTLLLLC